MSSQPQTSLELYNRSVTLTHTNLVNKDMVVFNIKTPPKVNDDILDMYIGYLTENIKESIINGEPFATSTIISKLVTSKRTLTKISNYFRSWGFVVYSPPSQELWDIAVLCASNNKLNYVQSRFQHNQNLDSIILIQLIEIPKKLIRTKEQIRENILRKTQNRNRLFSYPQPLSLSSETTPSTIQFSDLDDIF
jgi:hypothetical protein